MNPLIDFSELMQSKNDLNFDYVLSLRDVGDYDGAYECIHMSVLESDNKDGKKELKTDTIEVKIHADKSTWDYFYFSSKDLRLIEGTYKINSKDDKLHALYRDLLQDNGLKSQTLILRVFQEYFFEKLQEAVDSDHQSSPELAKE